MLQLADILRGVSPFPSRLGDLPVSSRYCLSRGWKYCRYQEEGGGGERQRSYLASLVHYKKNRALNSVKIN